MNKLTDLDFLSRYDEYKNKNLNNIQQFVSFLNSLTTNSNYHNKKESPYYNNSNDNLKQINNFLNKCTNLNIKKITNEVCKLVNKSNVNKVLESIIEKCILEPGYIDLYINIIKNIIEKHTIDITNIIDKSIETIYTDKTYSNDYNGLCEYNHSSDLCIALSLLISKLESENIINNYIKSIIKKCFNKIDIDNSDITYKYVNCLFKLFGSNPLLIHIFNVWFTVYF